MDTEDGNKGWGGSSKSEGFLRPMVKNIPEGASY
jgi:hypothetical protein